jgi:hypothetical protein
VTRNSEKRALRNACGVCYLLDGNICDAVARKEAQCDALDCARYRRPLLI